MFSLRNLAAVAVASLAVGVHGLADLKPDDFSGDVRIFFHFWKVCHGCNVRQ